MASWAGAAPFAHAGADPPRATTSAAIHVELKLRIRSSSLRNTSGAGRTILPEPPVDVGIDAAANSVTPHTGACGGRQETGC